jgi:hypothetical protein
LLAPPKTIVPVVIALGVTGVGLVGALVFGLSRGNAQSAANDIDKQIRAQTGNDKAGGGGGPGTCASTDPTISNYFRQPCDRLKSVRSSVDSNALLTNVSFGVAGVGLVAAVALYLFLPKADNGPPPKRTEAYRSKNPFESIRIDGISPVRYDNHGQGIGLTGRF